MARLSRQTNSRNYQIDNKPKVRDEIEVEEIEGQTGRYPLIFVAIGAYNCVPDLLRVGLKREFSAE